MTGHATYNTHTRSIITAIYLCCNGRVVQVIPRVATRPRVSPLDVRKLKRQSTAIGQSVSVRLCVCLFLTHTSNAPKVDHRNSRDQQNTFQERI